jgi:dTDP-glucose 4,6-dehydratase
MELNKMNWKNKSVLVTGAGGFIGSHLVEQLNSLGTDVRAFIRYTASGKIGNLEYISKLDEIDIFYGDLKDPYAVRKALRDIDIVFHLASLVSIPYSYVNPREYFDNNVNFILNILEATQEMGTESIIHTSTSEVYGTAEYTPIDEKHPQKGQSPYSASKIAADKVAESFFLTYNTPVVTIRPFNTYGPRQSSRAVIPTIITQLLQGMDLHLGDIETTRDFLYVKDTVKGFISAAEKHEIIKGKVINLGTGHEIKIGSVAKQLIAKINPKAKILLDKKKLRPEKSEVRRLCADITLAKEYLDWNCSFSLENGLNETVRWIKDNIETYSQSSKFK